MSTPQPMSAAMHFWTHLQPAQQAFLMNKYPTLVELNDEETFAQFVYDNQEHIRNLAGWPETQMRLV